MDEITIKLKKKYLTPISILVGGGLIAGAMFFNAPKTTEQFVDEPEAPNVAFQHYPTEGERVKGNFQEPKVVFIEYSDIDCPFCKQHHPTIERLTQEFDGAWIYRHFPLSAIHPDARNKSIMSECYGQYGGNTAFWTFIDGAFSVDNPEEYYDTFAVAVGAQDHEEILEGCDVEQAALMVDNFTKWGQEDGVRGTPNTIILTPNGGVRQLSGALPYEQMKAEVELLLNN